MPRNDTINSKGGENSRHESHQIACVICSLNDTHTVLGQEGPAFAVKIPKRRRVASPETGTQEGEENSSWEKKCVKGYRKVCKLPNMPTGVSQHSH